VLSITVVVTALTIDADASGNVVLLNARGATDGGGLHTLSILLASARPLGERKPSFGHFDKKRPMS
jgi:hypothetical protein